ncbi:hypothetical protein KY290_034063 [Solanum tuberosum]|uniref:Uncharacterized protein n=1 Tax=Solanum tuberosum TaxID=4113 RepID=A0ABQ7U5V8_SOLTU|nr:hypothetical protein KY289_033449 [Solanum tuberosum]KAH0741020.1 hypothetical protein KY290_034063 [Solanum tuberosum]
MASPASIDVELISPQTCKGYLFSQLCHLEDDVNLLNTMPFKLDEAAWPTNLLPAYKELRNTEMKIEVSKLT